MNKTPSPSSGYPVPRGRICFAKERTREAGGGGTKSTGRTTERRKPNAMKSNTSHKLQYEGGNQTRFYRDMIRASASFDLRGIGNGNH